MSNSVTTRRVTARVRNGRVSPVNCWMPEGFCNIEEARLDVAWRLLPKKAERDELRDWWLQVPRSANTPNWDIASTCSIDGQDGFLLVEAKAYTGELKVNDKTQAGPKNLQKIVDAIQQANVALSDQTSLSWALSPLLSQQSYRTLLQYAVLIEEKGVFHRAST